MGNAHMQFVEQTRSQGLMDGAGPMQGHVFLARELLCFRNRAFIPIRDEGIVRHALRHWCSGVRFQDNHRAEDVRAIRHDPPLLTVNLIEASVPHDHRAGLMKLLARDLKEMLHGASHPGEDLRDIIIVVSDKSVEGDRETKQNFSHGVLQSVWMLFYLEVTQTWFPAGPPGARANH